MVTLVQCLCPQRHCIVALTHDSSAGWAIRELLMAAVADGLERGELNPWCALCGATPDTWIYEISETRFATLAEAEPALRQLEAEQIRTADLLKRLGLAYDPPPPDTRN